jgi:hypothetical protein
MPAHGQRRACLDPAGAPVGYVCLALHVGIPHHQAGGPQPVVRAGVVDAAGDLAREIGRAGRRDLRAGIAGVTR